MHLDSAERKSLHIADASHKDKQSGFRSGDRIDYGIRVLYIAFSSYLSSVEESCR